MTGLAIGRVATGTAFDSKNLLKIVFFFLLASLGRRISFHWKRLRKRKKVGWNWNQARRGRGRSSYGKSGNRWKKRRGRRGREIRASLNLFCPVHRRKLAVAINKGAEFKLCVTRELERNGFFFCLLSLFFFPSIISSHLESFFWIYSLK